MESLHLPACVVGFYAGLVTLALIRGGVRFSKQPIVDLLKLTALAAGLSLVGVQTAVVAVVVAVAAFCLYNNLPSPRMPANNKAVFITGCDQGLGHELALQLDSLGVRVFAGCLFPEGEGASSFTTKASKQLVVVPLDVTDAESVQDAARKVTDNLEGKDLCGVVNNAGMMYAGCLEVMSEADIARLISVNYLGQLRVIRAFLPLLRTSRGRLVNVASNTGLAPAPFLAAYCSSKAAVAGLSECLRLELKLMGISVSTIIPSGYRTGIQCQVVDSRAVGDRWWSAASAEVKDAYGKDNFYPRNTNKDFQKYLNSDYSGIVNCMTDALLEKHPKSFYYKGLLARSLPFLYLHLPTSIADLVLPPLVTWFHFDPPGGRTNAKTD